jgi:hypothetical protein
MKIHSIGIAAQIKDIKPGDCFAFRREGTTYLAILTQEKTIATALWPKHPGGQLPLGQFSINDELWNDSLWILPEPIATPPPGWLAAVQFPSTYKDQLGSMVLAGSDTLVTVPYANERVAWLRLATGELIYQLPSVFLWFDRWSIMLPGPDGDLHTICTIPEPRPKGPMRISDEVIARAGQRGGRKP